MTKTDFLKTLATTIVAAVLTGCGSEDEPSSASYKVAATVGMIADIVREVAGDRAEVTGIIGEGVDPHLYKPTSSDVKELQAADVIFYNGLKLEGKMGDVLERIAQSGKPVSAVTEEILSDPGFLIEEDSDHHDPHVWMDVKGWIRAVNVVEKTLSEFDADNAPAYAENAAALRETLESLDEYAATTIATIPENQRVLVTAHDAFNYMARAYGLEVRGIQGLSTESEAGVRDIENLVNYLVEKKIPAVFVETSVSDKNVRALVEGTNARGHTVVIGGELFSDAMGPAGTYEGTYVGMIDHNVTTIAKALGGSPPEGGFQNKLTE